MNADMCKEGTKQILSYAANPFVTPKTLLTPTGVTSTQIKNRSSLSQAYSEMEAVDAV